LKYLALEATNTQRRFVVWLELKTIHKDLFVSAERAGADRGTLILQELWLKHLKSQLLLTESETELLSDYSQNRFRANDLVVLLDGFDELEDESSQVNLNKCLREFASALHDNTLLISTALMRSEAWKRTVGGI